MNVKSTELPILSRRQSIPLARHYFSFRAFAQRAFCAAAILALAAALIGARFFFGAATKPFVDGLPGPRFAGVPESNCLACSRREISASISVTMSLRLNLKLLFWWV